MSRIILYIGSSYIWKTSRSGSISHLFGAFWSFKICFIGLDKLMITKSNFKLIFEVILKEMHLLLLFFLLFFFWFSVLYNKHHQDNYYYQQYY